MNVIIVNNKWDNLKKGHLISYYHIVWIEKYTLSSIVIKQTSMRMKKQQAVPDKKENVLNLGTAQQL